MNIELVYFLCETCLYKSFTVISRRQLLVIEVIITYATITWRCKVYIPLNYRSTLFKLLFWRYKTIFHLNCCTDGNKDLDEHASSSSEGNICFELSIKFNTLNNVCMFQKMMMKKQRGRRPSKPKGKGLLWCLRRNAQP